MRVPSELMFEGRPRCYSSPEKNQQLPTSVPNRLKRTHSSPSKLGTSRLEGKRTYEILMNHYWKIVGSMLDLPVRKNFGDLEDPRSKRKRLDIALVITGYIYGKESSPTPQALANFIS